MALANKIQMVISAAGLNNRKMAPAFGCTENTAAAKFQRGITRIDDLVRIVDYCGAKITITTKDGTAIPLTVVDLPQKDAGK